MVDENHNPGGQHAAVAAEHDAVGQHETAHEHSVTEDVAHDVAHVVEEVGVHSVVELSLEAMSEMGETFAKAAAAVETLPLGTVLFALNLKSDENPHAALEAAKLDEAHDWAQTEAGKAEVAPMAAENLPTHVVTMDAPAVRELDQASAQHATPQAYPQDHSQREIDYQDHSAPQHVPDGQQANSGQTVDGNESALHTTATQSDAATQNYAGETDSHADGNGDRSQNTDSYGGEGTRSQSPPFEHTGSDLEPHHSDSNIDDDLMDLLDEM